ncbi:MAG: hypothetical protein FWD16_03915, partial [Clostridia bacterium]|nr:hypothetical protein [Clostridia bacterium]
MRKRFATLLFVAFFAALGISVAARWSSMVLNKQSPPPDDVAMQYLRDWWDGNYQGMYDALTDRVRGEWTLEAFADVHDRVYENMRVVEMTLDFDGADGPENGKAVARYRFSATLTGIGQWDCPELRMPMVLDNDIWQIVFTPEMILPGLNRGDRVRVVELLPKRGEILSADGVQLAHNAFADSIYVTLKDIPDKQIFSVAAADILGLDPEKVEANLNASMSRANGYAILRAYPSKGIPADVREKILTLPGVGIDSSSYTPIRQYPQGSLLSHTLGYMGAIDQNKLQKYLREGYTVDERVGLTGLEAAYEKTLYGEKGWRLQRVDEEGRVQQTYLDTPPQNGADLMLTVDTRIQRRAEELLADTLEEQQRGVIIAMQPSTGRVQAVASYPDFDPNVFSWPIP